ncbi:MAG: radical SAM protein [Armatimonadota bacterium]
MKTKINNNLHYFNVLDEDLIVNKNTGAVYEISPDIAGFFKDFNEYEDTYNEVIKELGSLITDKKSIEDYRKTAERLEKEDIAPNSLCLIISGNCNFRCSYCYGKYGRKNTPSYDMDEETSLAAVDFLFTQNSGNIEFDLFGGEPLLNWPVCVKTIEYIDKKKKDSDKKVKIALTTNGYLLSDEKIAFLNKYDVNLVFSLDGDKNCHDKMRKHVNGSDTFDKVYESLEKLLKSRKDNYYVRGTYAGKTLDFSSSFKFYMDKGIKYFSLEPIVRSSDEYGVKDSDLLKVDKEYDKCAKYLIEASKEGREFDFYHFNLNIYKPPCVEKRLRACAAGVKYFAVDYNGDIYPCHQFVGVKEFKMGSITEGVIDKDIADIFKKNHIFNKGECSNCWVKVYCSGGCAAANYFTNGDILKPDKISCDIMKIRTKYALAYNILKQRG